MEASSKSLGDDSRFQSNEPSNPSSLFNTTHRASEILLQRGPKELTAEAICMICLISAVLLLAFLGTSVTIYQFFFKDKEEKIKSLRNDSSGNFTNKVTVFEKGKKSNQDPAWLEDFKSFLKCFCLINNGRKILNFASSKGQIEYFNGLRVIGTAWVILIHTGTVYTQKLRYFPPENEEEIKPFLQYKAAQLYLNGSFAVDIFFVIRLTPLYMIVLGFYTTLFSYTGTGTACPTYDTHPACKKQWWWHFLYLNNFTKVQNTCMGWTWYLAADMQFYIISPLFMISLIRRPRFGYALTFVTICGSCVTNFLLTYQFDLIDGFSRLEFHLGDPRFGKRFTEFVNIVYVKPYTRISAYLVGLLLAIFLCQARINKRKIKNSMVTLYCGWITTVCFMWICIFSLYKREEVLSETAFYNGTKHLFFSLSLAWMIYVLYTGQAELINRCLSWKGFLPLSRLSYSVYLIHMLIVTRRIQQTEGGMDFSYMFWISLYIYTFFWGYVAAFIASLLFEVPTINCLDWLSKKKKKEKSN
ncbi:Nose resistant to fluoxetine protein 6 like protein [Argiope bruennichi]|uniref:Nose resistant to fluoxetine protein 6 like protein n=1 Tax=Argiope bruennichi TaxID=94029 RepID=A0A8T0FU17_ARGBR|nr:Nose resistant to fluoxetine protein 6 like protein [Argiope bruennichi]